LEDREDTSRKEKQDKNSLANGLFFINRGEILEKFSNIPY
jgi:hypothetical protein